MKSWLFLLLATGAIYGAPPSRIYPVEVKAYVMTDEQMLKAGNFYAFNKNLTFPQLRFNQLKDKPNFIVVFAKNQGEAFLTGQLRVSVSGKVFDLPVLGMPRNMEESAVWVIPVGGAYLGEGSGAPRIETEWKEFNVSPD